MGLSAWGAYRFEIVCGVLSARGPAPHAASACCCFVSAWARQAQYVPPGPQVRGANNRVPGPRAAPPASPASKWRTSRVPGSRAEENHGPQIGGPHLGGTGRLLCRQ
ncbi:hypothetical protein NDU88_004275 [Pleurodeles waltl]|uniref:Uncharacterized protein n=1 Tax=Pleurodeles waltl TaxID=8319 RepID=A0AAV7LJB4_PLEWA|nr:hypothetical protein NDU88_004275 [Pleurodeles waltl]